MMKYVDNLTLAYFCPVCGALMAEWSMDHEVWIAVCASTFTTIPNDPSFDVTFTVRHRALHDLECSSCDLFACSTPTRSDVYRFELSQTNQ